jgi:hypothetical protein
MHATHRVTISCRVFALALTFDARACFLDWQPVDPKDPPSCGGCGTEGTECLQVDGPDWALCLLCEVCGEKYPLRRRDQ